MRAALHALALAVTAAAGGACSDELPPQGPPPTEETDPLHVPEETAPAPGSLDDIHARVIEKRCSGQPGLCHNGQFEPNLSTPGLTYAYLVNRPSIEKPGLLRVRPGNASQSLFIDKIRNRNSVSTQMPLGAEPLDEADIAALEAWINDGALRKPGAGAAPALNNPPRRPQIAIYSGATRLDGAGPVVVSVGAQLTLRHSVQDFETPDASIPFAAVILQAADGRSVVLAAGNDPQLGPTTYDPAGPMGQGDLLNYRRAWTIGSQLELYREATQQRETVASAGQVLTVLALYVDSLSQGIIALDSGPTIEVRP